LQFYFNTDVYIIYELEVIVCSCLYFAAYNDTADVLSNQLQFDDADSNPVYSCDNSAMSLTCTRYRNAAPLASLQTFDPCLNPVGVRRQVSDTMRASDRGFPPSVADYGRAQANRGTLQRQEQSSFAELSNPVSLFARLPPPRNPRPAARQPLLADPEVSRDPPVNPLLVSHRAPPLPPDTGNRAVIPPPDVQQQRAMRPPRKEENVTKQSYARPLFSFPPPPPPPPPPPRPMEARQLPTRFTGVISAGAVQRMPTSADSSGSGQWPVNQSRVSSGVFHENSSPIGPPFGMRAGNAGDRRWLPHRNSAALNDNPMPSNCAPGSGASAMVDASTCGCSATSATGVSPYLMRASLNDNEKLIAGVRPTSECESFSPAVGSQRTGFVDRTTDFQSCLMTQSDESSFYWQTDHSTDPSSVSCLSDDYSGQRPEQLSDRCKSESASSKSDTYRDTSDDGKSSQIVPHPVPNRKNVRLQMFTAQNRNNPRNELKLTAYQRPKKRLSYGDDIVKRPVVNNNNNGQTNIATVEEAPVQQEQVPDSWEDRDDLGLENNCCDNSHDATVAAEDNDALDWFNPSDSLFESAEKSKNRERSERKWKCNRVVSGEWTPVASVGSKSGEPVAAIRGDASVAHLRQVWKERTSNESSDSSVNWKLKFWSRYSSVTTPYIDSHCHLDFMYKRTGFAGSFEKFRATRCELFPPSFAGCVTVFCDPSSWIYESEGYYLIVSHVFFSFRHMQRHLYT
jgi:hypothetical protein